MVIRFRIGTLLVVTALVALLLGLYAPELRSPDQNARVIFAVSGVIAAVTIASFTPAWFALAWLRRRRRKGWPSARSITWSCSSRSSRGWASCRPSA